MVGTKQVARVLKGIQSLKIMDLGSICPCDPMMRICTLHCILLDKWVFPYFQKIGVPPNHPF